jgi:hypothetical protein
VEEPAAVLGGKSIQHERDNHGHLDSGEDKIEVAAAPTQSAAIAPRTIATIRFMFPLPYFAALSSAATA